MLRLTLLLTTLLSLIISVPGSNILFITLIPSPSHDIWNAALAEGLLARGHHVTLLGVDDSKISSKNCTHHKIEGVVDVWSDDFKAEFLSSDRNILEELFSLWPAIIMLWDHYLKSDTLTTILEYPRNKFDLIIFDVIQADCFYPLIEHFNNPPVIGVSPFGISPFVGDTYGLQYYSYIPMYVLPYNDDMTFFQRIQNVFLYATESLSRQYYRTKLFKMTQERFGDNIRPFDEVDKQFGIMLTNYDPILDYPYPLPPNIIPVGGLQSKPPKKLPEDLQRIFDNAKDGVIYFSFGTNIVPSWMSKERKQAFLDTFAKLKQIVLWKYDGDDLTDIPKNVVIRKWCPQNDILGHKNVKLFISHNGGLSTQETIYHGVPVIGVPFFADQHVNAEKIENRIIGKRLDNNALTAGILYAAITEVLTNPIYKENMQKLSAKYRDQTETPLERAVFWTEYVLRHKNVTNLSPKGRYMTYYQRENLDIFGFFLIVILVVIYLLYIFVRLFVKLAFGKKKNEKIKKN